MTATITYNRHTITITTEHAASSYGLPVVLLDGQLTDISVEYTPAEPECPSALEQLATMAHVHDGRRTRKDLSTLADELCPEGIRSGADADRVVAEFQRRGREMRATEE